MESTRHIIDRIYTLRRGDGTSKGQLASMASIASLPGLQKKASHLVHEGGGSRPQNLSLPTTTTPVSEHKKSYRVLGVLDFVIKPPRHKTSSCESATRAFVA